MTTMTKTERSDLARLVRQRARVAKAAASQRAAELLADFERQLGAIYEYDQDETWQKAHAAAKEAVKSAKAQIAERCAELGIPKEFAPDIDLGWYGRGQNAMKDRRAELRKMATTRIAALEKAAKTEIDRRSVETETALITDGLTSDAARQFLDAMPTAEALMPTVDAGEIKGLLSHG